MSIFRFFIGVDIAAENFTSSIFKSPAQPLRTPSTFENASQGFEDFYHWLSHQSVKPTNCIICMEATGVYGEQLCYWLAAKGYQIAVEPPLKVKRAFATKGHKNDKADSKQIAVYAYRYHDELHFWQPKSDIVEQIKVLLAIREQFVQQKTANINSLHALEKKVVQTPLANRYYHANIERLSEQIKNIETEIEQLIDKDPNFKKTILLLKTVPGVALLLAANLLVITNGFTQWLDYVKLAAFIGICPYEHRSGSSVFKKPRSARYGPARSRKLLRLAARSVKTHRKTFQLYFLQKSAQGKDTSLILNNISNKLLRIICAIIKNQKPYVENYQSLNPILLK